MAWPFVLRSVRGIGGLGDSTGHDIGTFHGYTGPLAWGALPGDPWLAAAGMALREAWRSLGVVSLFARLHPLVSSADVVRVFDDVPGGGATRFIGPAVSIDCEVTDEEAQAGYARVTRQEIARARRAGLDTEVDRDWRSLDTFVRLYATTMDRNGAGPEYRLSGHDVERLREALGPRLALLVTSRDGHVAAAGLFTSCDGIAQAIAVGTAEAARQLSPLKLLLDDARRWAHERGDRLLFLGGGRGGRADGLFDFKRRFSAIQHHVHAGAWILDASAYRQLTRRRSAWLARRGRRVSSTYWFPTYRAPVHPLPLATSPFAPSPRAVTGVPVRPILEVITIDMGQSIEARGDGVREDRGVVGKPG